MKIGRCVDQVETDYNSFDVRVCFKLEIKNYTAFDLIAGDSYVPNGKLIYSSNIVKSGGMEVIAGRKDRTSLRGVEGVITLNIDNTEKSVSVMFSLPYNFTLNSNILAVGVNDQIEGTKNEGATTKDLFNEMYNGPETNKEFNKKRFLKGTESAVKHSDSINRFTAVGVMGKEHQCVMTLFIMASNSEEQSLTGKLAHYYSSKHLCD